MHHAVRQPTIFYPAMLMLLAALWHPADAGAREPRGWQTMEVTATSFTLAEDETKRGNVGLTAFGDLLEPTSKAIAVSRDLLRKGLSYGTKIRVEGLPGVYTVRDKMHRRWRDKIDILFARKKRALEWGRQTVTIRYLPTR
ncbi:hypothetical protein [Salinisphaera sp. T31B1]|uniref:3D domain-containing protein n=1 Tax=Salinisphaera sp. T31B1 TaxID=727963 RepID=UPI00333F2999